MKIKPLLTISALILITSLSSCSRSPNAPVKDEPITTVPMPADADKVTDKLIAHHCRSMDAGYDERMLCHQVVAAKLPPLDPNKRDHFGEHYNPAKYIECKLKAKSVDELNRSGNCDIYKLRRLENPEYWPYPDVPKPKYPEGPNPPTYQAGMSADDYFKALCEKEAGEFIYKTVENVEGIYQIRPRGNQDGDEFNQDRYVMEDPAGYYMSGGGIRNEVIRGNFYIGPNTYQYFETQGVHPLPSYDARYYDKSLLEPIPENKPIQRYYGYDRKERRSLKVEFDWKTKSQYGFTWRGISRPQDRQLGIAGGELIVLDLKTNEILGVRRNFAKSGKVKNTPSGFWWLTARKCTQFYNPKTQWPYHDSDFVFKVLKPAK